MRLKAIKDVPVSEVEAKKQLLQANKQLQRFKSMFGDDASSDASGLAEQLRAKESELESLRLQLQEREQVCLVTSQCRSGSSKFLGRCTTIFRA